MRREQLMSQKSKSTSESVKEAVVSAANSERDITLAVVDVVSGSLEDAMKHTADLGSAISEVVRGAFRA